MVRPKLKPLTKFEAKVVQKPLNGLLFNIDRELEKKLRQSQRERDIDGERVTSLFLMMLRFTVNSYETVRFLNTKDDGSHLRKDRFALAVPPINRQILDLLFTLVYMLDDFEPRSGAYELSGYRNQREELAKFQKRFGDDAVWADWLRSRKSLCSTLEEYLRISPEQKREPQKIKRWPTPSRIIQKATPSKAFLEFLHTWLYDDTSAQAHLTAGGLFSVGMFVVSDLLPEPQRQLVEDRVILQYQFVNVSRTFAIVLAIASEINCFFNLGHGEAVRRIWTLLGGYSEESKDLYERRYKGLAGGE
jgi:hypothetical protein